MVTHSHALGVPSLLGDCKQTSGLAVGSRMSSGKAPLAPGAQGGPEGTRLQGLR